MLKHRTRRDHKTGLPRPAHQLDRDDAVAPKRKEVVVDARPAPRPEPQHKARTGSPPAASAAPRRAARTADAPAQAAPDGRACRSASAATAPAPQSQTAPCSPAAAHPDARAAPTHPDHARPPQPHSPPAAAPAATSCRATTAACDTPPCRSSAASISPGSIRKPRSFSCWSARPTNSSTPSERHRARSPLRYIRLPATAMRVRHKPLRRQPKPPQIAPRQTRARNVKLPRNPRRHRLQPSRPIHTPACSRSDGRSAEQ